jgi:hypothetical protein
MTVVANLAAGPREPLMQMAAGQAGVSLEAVSGGGSHGMGDVVYRSKVTIEREKGPLALGETAGRA